VVVVTAAGLSFFVMMYQESSFNWLGCASNHANNEDRGKGDLTDDTRQPTKNGQADVDEEICAASTLQEDWDRWEKEC
jgi:hypothetical protein